MSMTVVPLLLPYTKQPDPEFFEKQRTGMVQAVLTRIGKMTRSQAVILWLIAIPLGIASLLAAPSIPVGANVMNYFKEGDPIREDVYAVDRALGGTSTLEFLVETEPEGLKEPEILQQLDTFGEWLEALPEISQTLSIIDILKETRRAMAGGDPAEAILPDSEAMTAQLFLLIVLAC